MNHSWHEAVRLAADRIAPYIRRTPLEYSPALSRETGADVYLKLEMLQVTGSFKLRGAANKLLSLPETHRQAGVITASTGNHGAGVLHIAQQLDIPVEVYLPETADLQKVQKLRDLGATIVQSGDDSLLSELAARQASREKGLPFISPYNDTEIIAGQGTMTLEILEDLPDAEAIFVPVGGGGLISGAGAALSGGEQKVELIGCQPVNSAVMHASVQAGKILDLPSLPTLSDGTAGGLEPDSITFPLCQDWVDEFVDVSEEEIAQAMYSLFRDHRFVVEGAAGLSVAALRKEKAAFTGKRVVLVLCGRNVGIQTYRKVLDQHL